MLLRKYQWHDSKDEMQKKTQVPNAAIIALMLHRDAVIEMKEQARLAGNSSAEVMYFRVEESLTLAIRRAEEYNK